MSLDPRAWRRFDAKAWAEQQSAPAKSPRRSDRKRSGHGATFAQMGAAWVIFALGVTSIALASGGGSDNPSATAAKGEGKSVLLGKRNPKSGEATHETAVVNNEGGNGLVIRPSNTAKGGRAISATCDNDGTNPDDGCAVYVNKGTGAAATFRTSGTVPFAIRDTNTGVVKSLNADRVDDVDMDTFRFHVTAATGLTQILNFQGLVLRASCTAPGILDLTAESTVANSEIHSYSVDPTLANPPNENTLVQTDADPGEQFDMVPDDEDFEVGQLRYTKGDGSGVAVQWDANNADANICGVSGVASSY
jgi:hypothetical protein